MRGKPLPMDMVLRDCQKIYDQLHKRIGDGRSMVHDPTQVFKPFKHRRTYWGYFRDAGWLRRVEGKLYSLDIHAIINEEAIQNVRKRRTKHRQNAEFVKKTRSAA